MKALTLYDLVPSEADLTLSQFPDKKIKFSPFSLAKQIWARNRFGEQAIKEIFQDKNIPALAELAHELIVSKEALARKGKAIPPGYLFKEDFANFMDFADCVLTTQDKVNLMRALLETIGMSQPIVERIQAEVEANQAGSETQLGESNTSGETLPQEAAK